MFEEDYTCAGSDVEHSQLTLEMIKHWTGLIAKPVYYIASKYVPQFNKKDKQVCILMKHNSDIIILLNRNIAGKVIRELRKNNIRPINRVKEKHAWKNTFFNPLVTV